MFPPDICDALSKLHSSAPSHSYAFTRYAIERAFKRNMDDIFSDFEQTPVASGSIAQVHRAVLNDGGAFGSKFKAGTVVAVKVHVNTAARHILSILLTVCWKQPLPT